MTELVWKDIMVVRWFLVILIPFYAIQLATFVQTPLFFLVTASFTALLGFGSIAFEDRQNTESLWCSLPVTRREVVLARYLSTGLGIFLGLAVSWLVGRIIAQLADAEGGRDAATPPGLQAYVGLFILLGLFAAVFLPCYFRFGAGKGLLVFSAIGVGALIVIPVLLQLALLFAGYSNSLLDPELWAGGTAGIGPEERERLAHWAIGVTAVLVTAAVLLSAALSVRFYEKRDLCR